MHEIIGGPRPVRPLISRLNPAYYHPIGTSTRNFRRKAEKRQQNFSAAAFYE